MVKFANDTMVDPKESSWFGYYTPGQDKEIESLLDSKFYTKDRLGLQKMNSDGKLIFLENPGNHLQFSSEWFVTHVIPYLK